MVSVFVLADLLSESPVADLNFAFPGSMATLSLLQEGRRTVEGIANSQWEKRPLNRIVGISNNPSFLAFL